jgi:hypothetical protein
MYGSGKVEMKDNRVEKPSNAGPLLHYCEIAVCDIKVI